MDEQEYISYTNPALYDEFCHREKKEEGLLQKYIREKAERLSWDERDEKNNSRIGEM